MSMKHINYAQDQKKYTKKNYYTTRKNYTNYTRKNYTKLRQIQGGDLVCSYDLVVSKNFF